MNEFKVGDKVQLNPDCKSFKFGKGGVEFGEVGEISTLNNEAVIIKFPSHNSWSGLTREIIPCCKTSEDLKIGDIVTLRNGVRMVFFCDEFYYLEDEDEYSNLTELYELNDDLTMMDRDYSESDIIKVERPMKYMTIFDRSKGVKEMTISEISKALGFEVKIVKEAE